MDTELRFRGIETEVLVHPGSDELQEGMLLLVFCQGCGKSFEWVVPLRTSQPPHFHSRACRRRLITYLEKWGTRPCPHPEKRRYRNHVDAEIAFREHTRKRGFGAQPYRCRCGNYHLGNPSFVIVSKEEQNGLS